MFLLILLDPSCFFVVHCFALSAWSCPLLVTILTGERQWTRDTQKERQKKEGREKRNLGREGTKSKRKTEGGRWKIENNQIVRGEWNRGLRRKRRQERQQTKKEKERKEREKRKKDGKRRKEAERTQENEEREGGSHYLPVDLHAQLTWQSIICALCCSRFNQIESKVGTCQGMDSLSQLIYLLIFRWWWDPQQHEQASRVCGVANDLLSTEPDDKSM